MTTPGESAEVSDVRVVLDKFLLATYQHAEATNHESPIATDDLAKKLGISDPFAEKIATFLESEGLLDYDNQAVDITIEGMLRAESLLRPRPAKKQEK
jgi:Mn-dependent DtxR family transcriptional regulator